MYNAVSLPTESIRKQVGFISDLAEGICSLSLHTRNASVVTFLTGLRPVSTLSVCRRGISGISSASRRSFRPLIVVAVRLHGHVSHASKCSAIGYIIAVILLEHISLCTVSRSIATPRQLCATVGGFPAATMIPGNRALTLSVEGTLDAGRVGASAPFAVQFELTRRAHFNRSKHKVLRFERAQITRPL
jgi:hypothetical protein